MKPKKSAVNQCVTRIMYYTHISFAQFSLNYSYQENIITLMSLIGTPNKMLNCYHVYYNFYNVFL